MEVVIGSDTPAGTFGWGVVGDITGHLSLTAAVGIDTNGDHFRAAVGSRFRMSIFDRVLVDASLGMSYEDGTERRRLTSDQASTWSASGSWGFGYFVNPEIGGAYQLSPRLAIRVFGGYRIPVYHHSCVAWQLDVASGHRGYHFHRYHRVPGAHPLARRRIFALPVAG